MNSIIQLAKKEKLNNSDIADLALVLSKSGETLSFKNQEKIADIPSTGGPSSLSTLLCPLILNNLGFQIPKLGIKGRPAGAIDVLAQIRNYKIDLEIEEIKSIINDANYCHFISNNKYAPLDARLFEYRAKNKAKAIPPLVIASILSKKLSVGLGITGLDIRVFKGGNFGTTKNEAAINAKRFIEVADSLGINSKCFISDFSALKQPYIGRGESLLALNNIFNNQLTPLLKQHLNDCIKMCNSLAKNTVNYQDGFQNIQDCFRTNLESQGASYEDFEAKATKVKKGHKNYIKAKNSGFLKIDLAKLRSVLVQQQNFGDTRFPDCTGVIFLKYSNKHVNKNDRILSFRNELNNNYDLIEKLNDCVDVTQSPADEIFGLKIIENA